MELIGRGFFVSFAFRFSLGEEETLGPRSRTLVHAISPRHDSLRDGTVGTWADFERFHSRLFVDHLLRLGVHSVPLSSFSSCDDRRPFSPLTTRFARENKRNECTNSRNHECVSPLLSDFSPFVAEWTSIPNR